MLLGLFANGLYDEQKITMQPGDQLFMFTDGIIDYTVSGETKSDYNLFIKRLETITDSRNSFEKLKQFLITQPPSSQVDDASIIHIYKTA